MKSPVHSVQKQGDRILVKRLKSPCFVGYYDADSDSIVDVTFSSSAPDNTEALYKKAAAAAKSFLRQ